MTRGRQLLVLVIVALVAAAAGYGVHLWRLGGSASSAAAQAVLAAQWPDLEGRQQALAQWRGKVLVVNFWATWCAPCREEIPVFVRMQEKYGGRGLQFVGVAIDRREQVQAFAREFGINYPILIGGIDAIDISRQAGNRVGALPFTVIFDREARIVASELGEAKEGKLDALVRPLL